MTEKVIPIINLRNHSGVPLAHAGAAEPARTITDSLTRALRELRISLTDRCNFRCVYCMPKEIFGRSYPFLPHDSLLSFEEIVRLARSFVSLGVEKIRLTGGEPLLRKNIEQLVAMLSELKTPDGRKLDLTLTTNGSLLAVKAQALKVAGLTRITVSLDALDDAIFRKMNDAGFPVSEVLHGIAAAHAAGFEQIKINMVVKAGINDSQIVPLARYFKGSPHIVRFIEYMDVGTSNHWKMNDVLPSEEVIRRIHAEMPLAPLPRHHEGETATRWAYADGSGEIGVISSVTQAFCGSCTRARLSAEGKLFTCLFASGGHDLRTLLKNGASDEAILTEIANVWQKRDDRYSELRSQAMTSPRNAARIEMSYIGG